MKFYMRKCDKRISAVFSV